MLLIRFLLDLGKCRLVLGNIVGFLFSNTTVISMREENTSARGDEY